MSLKIDAFLTSGASFFGKITMHQCKKCGRLIGSKEHICPVRLYTRWKHKRTYSTWNNMKNRCSNEKHKKYSHYGGRGISFSTGWDNFEKFLEDMGERPEGKTLDRIDNNGDYCKENCRWATLEEQYRNTRRNFWIIYKDEKMIISDCSRKYNIPINTIKARLQRNWSVERTLMTKPIVQNKKE